MEVLGRTAIRSDSTEKLLISAPFGGCVWIPYAYVYACSQVCGCGCSISMCMFTHMYMDDCDMNFYLQRP